MSDSFSHPSSPDNTGSFDPYHKLLGISQREQPPSLYRLLGIEALEDDREVIDAAANKQMSYLQDCCNGEHAAEAQRLINEVAEARLRLLNPTSKAQYDEQLRASLAPEPSVTTPVMPVQPVIQSPTGRTHRRTKKSKSGASGWIFGTMCSCLSIFVIWKMGWIDWGQKARPVAQQSTPNGVPIRSNVRTNDQLPADASRRAGSVSSVPQPSKQPDPLQPKIPPKSSPIRSPTSLPTPNAVTGSDRSPAMVNSSSVVAAPDPSLDGEMPIREVTAEEKERLGSFRSLGTPEMPDPFDPGTFGADPAMGSRLPIPDANEIADAESRIQTTLEPRIKAAKSPRDQQDVARQILDLSRETYQPAAKYVLLKKAQEQSIEAGDYEGAMLVIDQLRQFFEIDRLQTNLSVLDELSSQLYRPLDQIAMADRTEALIGLAMKEENYDAAIELCGIAKKLSQQLRNSEMTRKFSQKLEEIQTLQKAYPMVVLARQRLETEPDNAKANELLGRFHCFAKSQWVEGLPMLRYTEVPELREIVDAELKPPGDVGEVKALADRWWDFSDASVGEPMVAKRSREHAIDWYRRGIVNGSVGLPKVESETRIASYEKDPGKEIELERTPNAEGSPPTRPRAVPQEALYFNGNWYLFSDVRLTPPQADQVARRAGGRLVVVRSQAEHDFLVAHARLPLLLGMTLREGTWYDALDEKQTFFLWDKRNRQPESDGDEAFVAIYNYSKLWHDYNPTPLYFAIEWGRE